MILQKLFNFSHLCMNSNYKIYKFFSTAIKFYIKKEVNFVLFAFITPQIHKHVCCRPMYAR